MRSIISATADEPLIKTSPVTICPAIDTDSTKPQAKRISSPKAKLYH